jgi:hypothetical protein
MEERRLRVTRWLRTVPAVAICTLCDQEFSVPLKSMKSLGDAQQFLEGAFAEHDCESESL